MPTVRCCNRFRHIASSGQTRSRRTADRPDITEVLSINCIHCGVVEFQRIPVDRVGVGCVDHRAAVVLKRAVPGEHGLAPLQSKFSADKRPGRRGREQGPPGSTGRRSRRGRGPASREGGAETSQPGERARVKSRAHHRQLSPDALASADEALQDGYRGKLTSGRPPAAGRRQVRVGLRGVVHGRGGSGIVVADARCARAGSRGRPRRPHRPAIRIGDEHRRRSLEPRARSQPRRRTRAARWEPGLGHPRGLARVEGTVADVGRPLNVSSGRSRTRTWDLFLIREAL